jgi:hypothetical protein
MLLILSIIFSIIVKRIGSAVLILNCQNKSDPKRDNHGNEKLIALFGFALLEIAIS